ncbi:hypothetical protein PENTCL1PPCAC_8300, partial [Pristionchus entomophagus]
SCQHKYHRSCLMHLADLACLQYAVEILCCYCRTPSTAVIDEDGVKIPLSFPFETNSDDWGAIENESSELLEYRTIKIIEIFESLANQKRLALREGRSLEYTRDLDEEMEKYKKRYLSLVDFRLIVIEKEEIERISQEAAAATAEELDAAGPPEEL